jgi:hypothetical protein
MKIKDNSIVDTIIDFANVKFGVEMKVDQVSDQLKNMSFSETLKLVDAIKNDDKYAFLNYVDLSAVQEAYGTGTTASPSRATTRQASGVVQNRRANISAQDQARDSVVSQRSVAGGNKQATGQGSNSSRVGADPDDVQRDQNSQAVQNNAAEIERLKQLAMGKK